MVRIGFDQRLTISLKTSVIKKTSVLIGGTILQEQNFQSKDAIVVKIGGGGGCYTGERFNSKLKKKLK